MKTKLYLLTICTSILFTGSVFGGIPGKCPEVPKDWDGKENLEGWSVDPSYAQKVETKLAEDKKEYRPYNFLNAWLYFPAESNNKPAVCHYNYEGKRSNQLSLIIKDKNTENSHFEPNKFVNPGTNNQGIHCKQPATIDDCEFKDGPTVSLK